MNMLKSGNPALLLVDLQKGFYNNTYWGDERNNPCAEMNVSSLLTLWRKNKLPVFHILHCSLIPASPLNEKNEGNKIIDAVAPRADEPIVKKNVNSAFIGTGLQARLIKKNITQLVIVGLTTDHCISTTVRMAGNLGFDTFLVSDATATFNKKGVDGKNYPAQLIHETALASLHNEFAQVVTTEFITNQLKRMI